jgi:hypothetical protein
MWVPVGKALDESRLSSLEPTEVLYEFEGDNADPVHVGR